MAAYRHGCSWLSRLTGWCRVGSHQFLSSYPAAAGALASAALLLSSLGDLAVAAVERVA